MYKRQAYNGGGGVGILGEGASGAGSTSGNGFGGSGGGDGTGPGTDSAQSQTGGDYGGGSSGRWAGNTGGKGAVRIIWGDGRSFPSTNTADSGGSPQSEFKLDRLGIALGTTDPSGASAGDIYYNTDTNKVRLYDGSSWKNV